MALFSVCLSVTCRHFACPVANTAPISLALRAKDALGVQFNESSSVSQKTAPIDHLPSARLFGALRFAARAHRRTLAHMRARRAPTRHAIARTPPPAHANSKRCTDPSTTTRPQANSAADERNQFARIGASVAAAQRTNTAHSHSLTTRNALKHNTREMHQHFVLANSFSLCVGGSSRRRLCRV